MSVLSKLAGQTAVYGVSSIIGRFLNYLLVPLYTYKLASTAEYGVVSEFYAYSIVLLVLLTYGMETGFFRFSSKQENKNTVFTTVLTSIFTTSIVFISLVIIFSGSISNFIGHSNHSEYVVFFALILGIDAFTAIFFARLRQQNKPKKFAIFKLLNIFISISLNLFFVLVCPYLEEKGVGIIVSFFNPDYLVGYIFVSNLIASIVTLLLFLPEIFKVKIVFDFSLLKRILIYSLPLLITGLTGAINEASDKILIKYWIVPPDGIVDVSGYAMTQLGIYSANAKFAVIMMMFVQAFRYAAEPFFFSYSKNNDSLKVFGDVMKYYVIFAFIMFLFVMLNLDLIKYFINPTYFEGLNVVLPLFLSRFLVGVFFVLSFWYKLNDLTKYGIVIFSLGAIVTIGLNYLLIPLWGYIGAAWTNFAAYFLMVVISYFWSRKYMKVKYQYIRIFIYVFFALILYFISTFIDTNSIILNILIRNSFLIIYIISIFKIEKRKLSDLKQLIPKRK